ncbi:MAG: hypothetical protein K0U78_02700 [Actinomycetia bacterium]|nr:hypothetical protein [Actinomycetes bacterium]
MTSLLDSTNVDAIVFLEETTTDADGNTRTRASATGIPTRVRVWPQNQSGTSARRAEQADGGFSTEQVYGLRFPRSWPHALGAQSAVEIDGKRWSVFGDPVYYNGSARTRHTHYTIRRS